MLDFDRHRVRRLSDSKPGFQGIGHYTMPRIITLLANVYAINPNHWIEPSISTSCYRFAGDTIGGCTVVSASVVMARPYDQIERIQDGPLAGWHSLYTMALVVIAPDELDAQEIVGERNQMYRICHGLGVQIVNVIHDTASPEDDREPSDWQRTTRKGLGEEEPLVRFEDL